MHSDITVEQLKALLDRKAVTLLDVRTEEEWQQGRIEHAILIPLHTLETGHTALDTRKEIAVICRSGNRSSYAAQFLSAQGFKAANVLGGMLEWKRHGYPVRA